MTCVCGFPDCPGKGGGYYVSVKDGPRFGLLAGPYETHAEALARISEASRRAIQITDWACFYHYGTVRIKDTYRKLGVFGRL